MAAPPEPPVVLITGATGALGRAAAAAFAADGARLGLAGRDPGRLQALAHELRLGEAAWTPVVADLRDADAARAAVAGVQQHFGRVDVLLHLVGGWVGGTALTDLDAGDLEDMLGRHVWSTFHTVRAVVPGMVARRWGRIVAVTSSSTTAPGPRSAAYVAAKAGQESLLRVLAREVAADGVTVNLIAVQAIDADRAPSDRSPKPARSTTPEEIVSTIRFLVSDASAAVNGQRISLDGRG